MAEYYQSYTGICPERDHPVVRWAESGPRSFASSGRPDVPVGDVREFSRMPR
ncbi:hypothetical protein [Actinomadura viridis]|uniref:Uncharacterized protein n=1 Tax=Actinomadura viridis TaxID=58110 RepID=A0A931DL80_9ACTN|nr:hypothetical protein [Actinomadura viridis]MBG6091537.1 hypothetical protein [Actinomadura viridis]